MLAKRTIQLGEGRVGRRINGLGPVGEEKINQSYLWMRFERGMYGR